MNYKGSYKVVVENDGVVTLDTGFQSNVFLDKFFSLARAKNKFSYIYCLLGSGSNTPLRTDTTLQNKIPGDLKCSYEANGSADSLDLTNDGSTFKFEYTLEFKSTKGQIQGNASELGLSFSSDEANLFTRALIKDAQGNPTTITLGPNDILTVIYKVGYTFDITNTLLGTANMNIKGQQTTIELHGMGYDSTDTNTFWKAKNISRPNGMPLYWTDFSDIFLRAYPVQGTIQDFRAASFDPSATALDSPELWTASNTADGTNINSVFNDLVYPAGTATGTWNSFIVNSSSSVPFNSVTLGITFNPPLVKGPNDEFTLTGITLKAGAK